MFNKLKYIFSFRWFYIILFLFLSISNFWDEIIVGKETIKFVFQNSDHTESEVNSKNKINFIEDYDIPLEDDLVIYNGQIEYIFLHPLISEENLSLSSKYNRKSIYNLFLTANEFEKFLNALYEKNYILIDIYDVYKHTYKDEKFKIKRQALKIPKGKKPIVLFIDNINFKKYLGESINDKLVLDEDNKVKSIIKLNGEEILSENYDIIPILNLFIEKHPEFSFNNARGIISLTGVGGIFGYDVCHDLNSEIKSIEFLKDLSKNIYDAQKVANKLKEDGWKFACNTYEYINLKNVTLSYIKQDIDNWFKYIANIVGSTDIFVYPYSGIVDNNDERFKYLNNMGFNVFCFSNKGTNKDTFTMKDYVNVYRDLISFETIKSGKKDFYKDIQENLK